MKDAEGGLFPALEKALRSATMPLDCNDLYEMPSIKKKAASVNRVSDYLGSLWRKGRVVRLPAKDSDDRRSRWRYEWKGERLNTADSVAYEPRVLADRPSMLITEEGNVVTIELANMVISIRQKTSGVAFLEGLKRG
jgi:hypothetical protein